MLIFFFEGTNVTRIVTFTKLSDKNGSVEYSYIGFLALVAVPLSIVFACCYMNKMICKKRWKVGHDYLLYSGLLSRKRTSTEDFLVFTIHVTNHYILIMIFKCIFNVITKASRSSFSLFLVPCFLFLVSCSLFLVFSVLFISFNWIFLS